MTDYRPTILALPADTHSGSPLGLMPSDGWTLSDGSRHLPNDTQVLLQQLWQRCWQRIDALRQEHGARLVVVHLGDAVEGNHHENVEVITRRIEEQEQIHVEVMRQGLGLTHFSREGGDRLLYVTGTSAHTGPGSASEERIARQFTDAGVIASLPDQNGHGGGRFVYNHLVLNVNGKLFDLAHHGAGLSRLPWNKINPLRSRLTQIYYRCMEEKRAAPDYWVRAHLHEAAEDVYIAASGQRIHGFVTPAFQSKTEFGYKIAADLQASLGMLFFLITAAGVVTPLWEKLDYNPTEVLTL